MTAIPVNPPPKPLLADHGEISFGRLVRTELHKFTDIRVSRWLLATIMAITRVVVAVMLFAGGDGCLRSLALGTGHRSNRQRVHLRRRIRLRLVSEPRQPPGHAGALIGTLIQIVALAVAVVVRVAAFGVRVRRRRIS